MMVECMANWNTKCLSWLRRLHWKEVRFIVNLSVPKGTKLCLLLFPLSSKIDLHCINLDSWLQRTEINSSRPNKKMIIGKNAGIDPGTKSGKIARSQIGGWVSGIFTLTLLVSYLLIGFILPGNQRSLVSNPHGRISATSWTICSRVNNCSCSHVQRLSKF